MAERPDTVHGFVTVSVTKKKGPGSDAEAPKGGGRGTEAPLRERDQKRAVPESEKTRPFL